MGTTCRITSYASCMTARGPAPASPVSPEEVAPTRRPVEEASLLPPRVFHDPEVFAWEREAWFTRSWLCVAREEDAAAPGEYVLVQAAGESIALIRGADGELRALYNVCRHRGARILEAETGRLARIQCPYHAWTYGLDGSLRRARHTEPLVGFQPEEHSLVPARLETWQGFAFVNLDDDAPPVRETLGDLPERVDRFDL